MLRCRGALGEKSLSVPFRFLKTTTGHTFKKIKRIYLLVLIKLSSVVFHLELGQDVRRGKRLLKDLFYTPTHVSVNTSKGTK